MITILSCLYILAAGALGYAAFVHRTRAGIVLALLAVLCMFEEQHWFIPLWVGVDTAATWPATNLTSVLAAAWAGLDGPTTIDALAVVALGRFAVLVAVFYGAILAFKRGAVLVTWVRAQPRWVQLSLSVWAGTFVLGTVFYVLAPETLGGAAVAARLVAALGCGAYATLSVRDLIHVRRASASPSTPRF